MPYQGRQPGVGVRNRFIFTATSGQTSFSGADSNGLTLKYADATYTDVFLNGVLLIPVTDYAATTKTSIVLSSGAATSDVLEVVAYEIASIANTVPTTGGTFTGPLTVQGNFTADGGTIKLDGNYPVGTGNVALGNTALDSLTSGNYNTTVGTNAGTVLDAGQRNTAFGYGALQTDTKGARAVALGFNALGGQNFTSATDNYNIGIGYDAGGGLTTGQQNVMIGGLAGDATTTGNYNVAIGGDALTANTTASNSTAVGYQAGYSFTTGGYSTVMGFQAAQNATAGGTVAIGHSSAKNNTGAGITAVGSNALTTNTSGVSSTGIGTNALNDNTTGSNNVALGRNALYNNTTASNNTAVGYQAAYSNTVGAFGTFVGDGAGRSTTTANNNTFFGHNAGYFATGAGNNFFGRSDQGFGAGQLVTTGGKNTILGGYNGNQGGLDIRTLSNRIVLSDGDGNPRAHCDSNADFYIGGATTRYPGSGNTANGFMIEGGQRTVFISRASANPLLLNRNTNDGAIVSIRQGGSEEGSISVSGTTVSYNGGHLSRWSQLTDNTRDDTLLKGTVLTNLDQMAVWGEEDNEQLNCMAKSSVEGDANVAGVFVNWDNDDDEYTNDMNIAMTGDMVIRIAQGTTIARGDLLMSAGDGTAKPQGDDIVRSKTIAKVTSTHISNTYDDGSFCVPCVLMAC